jgi:4-amino-4-deoxy-L-arabinose transferase-like glycosyltransferase
VIILLGTVLRVYDLGAESYWGDEVITLRVASQSIPQLIASFRLDEPLAYYLHFSLWIKSFGTTEAFTRLFSALLGIAAIFLVYRLGRELFGREIGLLSAFLMAISEFQIYYSQEIRPYTLFECSTLLYFSFSSRRSDEKREIFCPLGLSSLLLLASHAYGAFILLAQDLFFLLRLKKHRDVLGKWFLCQLPIFLAVLFYFLPMVTDWWEPVIKMASVKRQQVPNTSLSAPIHNLYYFTLPARHARSWGSVLPAYLVAGGFLVAGTWIYRNRIGKNPWLSSIRGLFYTVKQEPCLADKLLLLTCWLLCPIVLPFFLSQVIGRMYQTGIRSGCTGLLSTARLWVIQFP